MTKRTRWMPWQSEAMNEVVTWDKPRLGSNNHLSLGFLNGETPLHKSESLREYIAQRAEPGELTHLSTPRKRNQPRFRKERRAKLD
ncbi:hypothetical protein UF05_07655 [Vibrio sp. S457-15]|nr:hypothetical protein UF05_07655 [Vibrio sp. S457-15]